MVLRRRFRSRSHQHPDASAASGQVFNIGNPDAVTDTNGLAELIGSLVPGAKMKPGNVNRAEVGYRTPVIEKARKLLALRASASASRKGLKRTIEWTKSQLGRGDPFDERQRHRSRQDGLADRRLDRQPGREGMGL